MLVSALRSPGTHSAPRKSVSFAANIQSIIDYERPEPAPTVLPRDVIDKLTVEEMREQLLLIQAELDARRLRRDRRYVV